MRPVQLLPHTHACVHVCLQVRQTEARRFRRYIDQLLAEVLQQEAEVQAAVMTGLPRLQQDEPADPNAFAQLPRNELEQLAKQQESDNTRLENYINEVRAACFPGPGGEATHLCRHIHTHTKPHVLPLTHSYSLLHSPLRSHTHSTCSLILWQLLQRIVEHKPSILEVMAFTSNGSM